MGYRGKLAERAQAQDLRAQGWTMQEIAEELRVSKSSVSLWVRDVAGQPRQRRTRARFNGTNRLRERKEAEIQWLLVQGKEQIGQLSDREFLIAGAALYAGEGGKVDGDVKFANCDPRMIAFFCTWLRHFFVVDESRLRVRLYLHQGLDINAATQFWSKVTGIPTTQFGKAYRAVPDGGIRNSKHPMGCPAVRYSCSATHRRIMGLVHGLLDAHTAPQNGSKP